MRNFLSRRPVIAMAAVLCCAAVIALCFSVTRVKAQYKGDEKHAISLDQAAHLIQNFKNKPAAPATKGGYFGRNIFDQILAQAGTVGIRYYYAAQDDGTPTLVLVGVDSLGNDMEKGVIAEFAWPCPPYCSVSNSLSK